MTVFLISGARAVVEMLGFALLGQGVLFVLAGRDRSTNPIYQLFDLVTRAPRRLIAILLPSASATTVGVSSFGILLLLWLGLAYIRKFI